MAGFKSGILLGALLIGVPAGWLTHRLANQPIMFNSSYVGVEPGYVRVTGSVIGSEKRETDRPTNNGVILTCMKPKPTCTYVTTEELGPNHIGEPSEELLTIRKWDDKELIADSLDLSSAFQGCNYYEIRVLLVEKQATYTRLPNPKADKARCKQMFQDSEQLRQWRIGNGKGWSEYQWGEK